jgi:hypothetical protein
MKDAGLRLTVFYLTTIPLRGNLEMHTSMCCMSTEERHHDDAINRLKKITVIMCYVHVMYVEKNLPINKPYKMDLDFQLAMVFFFCA